MACLHCNYVQRSDLSHPIPSNIHYVDELLPPLKLSASTLHTLVDVHSYTRTCAGRAGCHEVLRALHHSVSCGSDAAQSGCSAHISTYKHIWDGCTEWMIWKES